MICHLNGAQLDQGAESWVSIGSSSTQRLLFIILFAGGELIKHLMWEEKPAQLPQNPLNYTNTFGSKCMRNNAEPQLQKNAYTQYPM